MAEQEYLTVTALTKYIKRKFDADPYLERVYLTGEVSNYRKRPNHQYFNIKDEKAVISAVMYKREFSRLKFNLEDGMKVLLVGRINVYEPSGSYNIIIEHIEPDGVGALYQAYVELRERLSKEGLFTRPKKQLPRYPKRIAVLTSPSGAVIRDIMTTINRRYPIVQIELYPTVVQGKDSVQSIVTNLKRVNEKADYDLVIMGRGGGSIEDLWSFNEEAVIRQIVDMTIPVISSVGHETDTTLSDLAADVRAATPTAAAELSVPVLTELLLTINKEEQRLYQAIRNKVAVRRETLNRMMQSYIFRQPKRLYEGHLMKVDQYTSRIQYAFSKQFEKERHAHSRLELQLHSMNPINQVMTLQKEWQSLDQTLTTAMRDYLKNKNQKLAHTMASLDLLSPLKIMNRGYAYVSFEDRILKSVTDVSPGQVLAVHLADGIVTTQVKEIKEQNNED
ncbi:Exodeoxyribonuclease 7 large subunit [Jeotgalibaca dankookensis]|uniref:Exodeoxyribonuclease 7 large subunit n=1 Tax=Jeotgalibaca dankookensis TaxID=708126 RepID=A0A1S6IPB8_9LACT|nr:exodeoxyribonuclease VII large subunit [Jeotgalibaca dankookensis]AQS53300.1 Exodeoxyribonuclease 7 large subunit [Jeotgalibaca dankookensis]